MQCPDCGKEADKTNEDEFEYHGSSKYYTHFTCTDCGKRFGYSDVKGYNT